VGLSIGCAAPTVLEDFLCVNHGLRALAKPRALHPWLSCRHAVGVRLTGAIDVEQMPARYVDAPLAFGGGGSVNAG